MNKYKLWRLKRGLTQEQAMEMFRISKATIWRLEKDKPLSDRTTVYVDTIIEKIEKAEED